MTFTLNDYQLHRAEMDQWLRDNDLMGELIFELTLTDDPLVVDALCYAKNDAGSRYLVAADGSPWVHHDKQPGELDPVAATVRKTFSIRTPPPAFVAECCS